MIHAHNAVIAAEYLLNIDINDVKPAYQKIIAPLVLDIKAAKQALAMTQFNETLLLTMIDTLQQMLPMLTEEAQRHLQQALRN